jgi:hypothetical protein
MRFAAALVALSYGVTCLAQSSTVISDGGATIVSGIDPSDVAAIPDPELLGPPVGVGDTVQTITYDAAAVTSSVLALVTAAVDGQTTVIANAAETSIPDAAKRSFVGSNANIYRRDTRYPIDTKSFVSIALLLESSGWTCWLTGRSGHSFRLYPCFHQSARSISGSWVLDLQDSEELRS